MLTEESSEVAFALIGIGLVVLALAFLAWLAWRLVRYYRSAPAGRRMLVVLAAIAVFHVLGLLSFFTFPFDFDTPRSLFAEALDIEDWVFPAIFAAMWALVSLLVVLRGGGLAHSEGLRTFRLLAVGICAALAMLAFGIVDSMDNALPLLRQLGADLPPATQFLIGSYQWWWLFPVLALAMAAALFTTADPRGTASRFASSSLAGLVFIVNASLFVALLSLFLPFFKMCGPMDLTTGYTRLHAAAALGREQSVRRQLAKGVTVDARDENGTTPLLIAVSEGHLSVASVLLEGHANANAATASGQTPLHAAASVGRVDIAEQLLLRGARVDAKDRHAGQPLHRAAYRGNLAVAALLLARGADVNAEDDQGKTPLDYATESKGASLMELIGGRGGVRSTKESRQHAAKRAQARVNTTTTRSGSCSV